MQLKIYRAADAFLYLPMYIAEDSGIFDTLLAGLGVTSVVFEGAPKEGGDGEAIKMMLKENHASDKTLAIAIADPATIASSWNPSEMFADARVIGAVINKLPFWAVNHVDREFDEIKDFKSEFEAVIHYNDTLKTGNYLGKKIMREACLQSNVPVEFGQELTILQTYGGQNKKAVAVTADIVSLVKGLAKDQLKINYRFSSDGDFLSTGIITSAAKCLKYPEILTRVIEGVQKSIAIMYASEKIATRVCQLIAANPTFLGKSGSVKLDPRDVSRIVKMITDETFYPADLNISRSHWETALRAMYLTEGCPEEEQKRRLEGSYERYVVNDFIVGSGQSLAKQFGIDLDTFGDEIEAIESKHRLQVDSLEARYQNDVGAMDSKYKAELQKLTDRMLRVDPFFFSFGIFLTSVFRPFKSVLNIRLRIAVLILFTLATIGIGVHWYLHGDNTLDTILFTIGGGVVGTILATWLTTEREKKKNE